jgi:hypothetical protein
LYAQNPTTLKLAALLAEYLYQKKQLNLTGIGTFSFDPSAQINSDAQHPSEGISFQHNASVKEDDNLVVFISAETGKMKTLASSDLASYVELGLQFLNIGKPLQIEGIGTLVKNKAGELEFTADHVIVGKVKETGIKELSATSISDELLTTYDTLKPKTERSSPSKRFFLAFLALATIAGIVWIGYRLNQPTAPIQSETAQELAPSTTDTTQNVSTIDTTNTVKDPLPKVFNNSFRFVIEVANRKRAFYRYRMLKNGNIPIRMSTTDSTTFKLYFELPATTADTARITDSLTSRYPSINKRKAFAEQ